MVHIDFMMGNVQMLVNVWLALSSHSVAGSATNEQFYSVHNYEMAENKLLLISPKLI